MGHNALAFPDFQYADLMSSLQCAATDYLHMRMVLPTPEDGVV